MISFEPSGLYNPEDMKKRYFRIGNFVINSDGGVEVDDAGNPDLYLDYPMVKNEVELGNLVKNKIINICNLKKGVSDVALYYGSMMITQELFLLNRRYPFFVLLLLGKHGAFKTMLAKRVISVLPNSSYQELKFYNLSKNTVLEETLYNTEIFTVLIDDIIPVNGYSQKKRYSDIFDWVSRSGDRERFKGGAIITAERIPEEVVSSAYDRIWEIKMPILNDVEKKRWYTVLSEVTKQDLAVFYVEYCRKLMMNYDSVMEEISYFWSSFELPGNINRKTRIADHFEYIVLSEYLLKKYYLEHDVTIASVCKDSSSTIKRAEIQQNRILKMDRCNMNIDIPYYTYQVLLRQQSKVKIILNQDEYEKESSKSFVALLINNYIFIKPTILLEAINDYTNSTIPLKKISTELEKEGILISGGGNSKTVTGLKAGRHYKLKKDKLINYRDEYINEHEEELEEEWNMIIPRIRKQKEI